MRIQRLYNNKTNYQVNVLENQRFSAPPATITPYGSGWEYNADVILEEDIYPDGTKLPVYYATSYRVSKKMGLNEIINSFIRCFYTVDDEFAIQRQRDTKPEKFKAYNDKVNMILEISEAIFNQFSLNK